MVDTIDVVEEVGAEVESYARGLGAEIYGVASADKYVELFPENRRPTSSWMEPSR